MPKTLTHTPWGWTRKIQELADDVWRVTTAGHGGLKLSQERWEEIPAAVRDTMLTPLYAEEDCEEPIVRTLLGVGDERDKESALRVAGSFERYAPALPYIRECQPEVHHVIAYRGGLATDPFERFHTREEAEAFVSDEEIVRHNRQMETIEGRQALQICMGKEKRI